MQVRAKKLIHDMLSFGRLALRFAAVERELEIVGEAMAQLAHLDPLTAARFTDYRKVISFRNLLIHAYPDVEASVVWNAARRHLPILLREAEALLAEPDDE